MQQAPPRKANRLRDAEGKSGPFRDAPRQSSDEVETMAMILNQLPVIRTLVLDRLKQAKARQRSREVGKAVGNARDS